MQLRPRDGTVLSCGWAARAPKRPSPRFVGRVEARVGRVQCPGARGLERCERVTQDRGGVTRLWQVLKHVERGAMSLEPLPPVGYMRKACISI